MQIWWIWLKKQILLYKEVVSWQYLFVEYSAENCTSIKSGLKLQTLSDSYPLSHTWRVGKQRRDACFLHFLKVHTIANYIFYWNDFTPWVFLNTDILSRKKGSSPISTSIQLSHRKKQQDIITLCFCWDKYLFFKFLQVPLNKCRAYSALPFTLLLSHLRSHYPPSLLLYLLPFNYTEFLLV